MSWPFRGNRQPIKLARKADSEIANIDHLLHFAFAFDKNLSRFERHKPRKVAFKFAQRIPEPPDRFAANRRGNSPPFQESLVRARHGCFIILRPSGADRGDHLAIDRRHLFERFAATEPFAAKHAWVYLLDS